MTGGERSARPPRTIEVAVPAGAYPVVVGDGSVTGTDQLLPPLPEVARRALLVTQTPVVSAGHVAAVESALEQRGIEVSRELVPDGEDAKRVDVLAGLWRAAAQVPLTRQDLVVAVGGGVVGDLAGFVAATFARGIAVVQVPTTLLAQVDAAIGGKTGINLPEGKNLVGAFHQPHAVVCDVATLATLTPRLLTEGLGEVVKYGLLADPTVLELLEAAPDAVVDGDPVLRRQLVERSVAVKAAVVADDEREAGRRAWLNLGHTYGHAVETLTGYTEVLHGEAVAIGTVVALELGVALGRTPAQLAARGTALLARLGLPTRPPVLDRDAVWSVMARDKKAGPAGVRFVVLDGVAMPTVVTPDRAEVDAVLDALGA